MNQKLFILLILLMSIATIISMVWVSSQCSSIRDECIKRSENCSTGGAIIGGIPNITIDLNPSEVSID